MSEEIDFLIPVLINSSLEVVGKAIRSLLNMQISVVFGSVVVRDMPDQVIAGWNPCKTPGKKSE